MKFTKVQKSIKAEKHLEQKPTLTFKVSNSKVKQDKATTKLQTLNVNMSVGSKVTQNKPFH